MVWFGVKKMTPIGKIRNTHAISDVYDTPTSVFWQAIFQANPQNCWLRYVFAPLAARHRHCVDQWSPTIVWSENGKNPHPIGHCLANLEASSSDHRSDWRQLQGIPASGVSQSESFKVNQLSFKMLWKAVEYRWGGFVRKMRWKWGWFCVPYAGNRWSPHRPFGTWSGSRRTQDDYTVNISNKILTPKWIVTTFRERLENFEGSAWLGDILC